MRVIFIGGGNIAEAIFSKLDNLQKHKIIVIQRNLQKIEILKTKYPNINFQAELDFETDSDDLIFLAIKPYDARTACQNLQNHIKGSVIISVISGISCQTLSQWLGNPQICRAMPNTPSMLGAGATGIYIPPIISNRQIILDIFTHIGKVYPFITEDQINQMTAVAGSSPAYIFYFIEALIKSAVDQFGFNQNLAKDITLQVVKGSLAMIEHNKTMSIEQLRSNVSSKKGTTEQAISIFEKYNLTAIVSEAELACYNRAKELSRLFAQENDNE